jgi:hypothetical protein
MWSRLAPGFFSRPTVLCLPNGQNPTPRSKNTGVTDLIPNGQDVVVYPQEAHGSHKHLRGVACELTFAPPPDTLEVQGLP